MRYGHSPLATGALAVLSALLAVLVTARPAPFGPRGSLIITEISPYSAGAADGVTPWLEIFNPLPDGEPISNLALERTDGTRYALAAGTAVVPAGGFVVIRFDDSPQPGSSGGQAPALVHLPQRLGRDWLPPHGELALLRTVPSRTGDFLVLDHVAWGTGAAGRPGGAKPPRWPQGWFVPLAEGFGVYDPAATLAGGASIGLHPGSTTSTPDDWSVFDPDETTPGARNRIPRPKAFTLADGATLGSRSFGVGWLGRKGDESYRFRLARDAAFTQIVIDEAVATTVVRISGVLADGRYWYAAAARSAGGWSEFSTPRGVNLITTPCDWPFPDATDAAGLRSWLQQPSCGGLPDRAIISSIGFRFQRKDTPLVCLAGCNRNPGDDAGPRCEWDSPHSYCLTVVFLPGPRTEVVCAGHLLSPTCDPILAPGPNEGRLEALHRLQGQFQLRVRVGCDHGKKYCGKAAISMMASAYGRCLSQDRIAYRLHSDNGDGGQLAHEVGQSCYGPPGDQCSLGLLWALDIEPGELAYKPDPSDDSFVAAYFAPADPTSSSAAENTLPVTFQHVRSWLRETRPIMFWNGSHIGVLSGYCESCDGQWLYVYDPVSGPSAQRYQQWRRFAAGIWVAPPATVWSLSANVRADEAAVWTDPDCDGLMTFDELRRFMTDPHDPCTGCSDRTDKERVRAGEIP